MKIVVFILTLIFANLSFAGLEDEEFAQIKLANSSERLLQVYNDFKSLKVNLKACEIQKRERLLPSACYIALNMAKKLEVEGALDYDILKLNRTCLAVAQETTETKNSILPEMSVECAQKAQARASLNQYKYGHDN